MEEVEEAGSNVEAEDNRELVELSETGVRDGLCSWSGFFETCGFGLVGI